MRPSLTRGFSFRLGFLVPLALGSCGTHSIIGQQTGTGGSPATGTGGFLGTGGLAPPMAGAPGTGGDAPGTGGKIIGGDGGSQGSRDGGSPGSGGICGASTFGGGLSFATPIEYPTHAGSTAVVLGDLNGDGKPDLVVGNYAIPPATSGSGGAGDSGAPGIGGSPGTAAGSVSVFLSSATGYDTPQSYDLAVPRSIATGDLNGDGKADVAVVNSQGVSVFFNDGTGALLSPVSFATGEGPAWVAVGDLNGDGKADLAVANSGLFDGSTGLYVGGDVAVLLNMGGGTFVASNWPAGASPVAVAIADFGRDGNGALAVASGTGVSVLLNLGKASFAPAASYGVGTNPISVAAGDLNGDGKLDLAVANPQGGGASVLLNLGDNTFAAAVNYLYTAPSSAGPIVIGDVNGDGRPDLVGNSWGTPCGSLAVLLNQGSGVFGSAFLAPFPSPGSVAVGNLNGDSKLDLVVPDDDGVAVLLNTSP